MHPLLRLPQPPSLASSLSLVGWVRRASLGTCWWLTVMTELSACLLLSVCLPVCLSAFGSVWLSVCYCLHSALSVGYICMHSEWRERERMNTLHTRRGTEVIYVFICMYPVMRGLRSRVYFVSEARTATRRWWVCGGKGTGLLRSREEPHSKKMRNLATEKWNYKVCGW